MEKDRVFQIRLSEFTANRLSDLATQYGVSKSEMVRRAIDSVGAQNLEKLFGVDVAGVILPFGDAYTLRNFSVIDGDYLSGKGFQMELEASFEIGLTAGVTAGATTIAFEGNVVYVNGGFLRDIQNALKMLYSSRR